MGTKVSIDGVQVDVDRAFVSVLDRGFLYGDSVFEVLRTYGGVPAPERLHLERLAASCARVGIALPMDLDVIRDEVRATHAATGNDESWIRVVITRGTGPISFDVRTAVSPVRVVIAQPLVTPPPEVYEQGVTVATSLQPRALDASPAAGAKSSNYLANLLVTDDARRRGAYEAVLLGPGGEVLEGASSNVLVARGGRLSTPPLTLGLLGGITRRLVLEAARSAGIDVREEVLFPQDLYAADEVLLTSSIREVVPVVGVDGVAVGDGRPGPLARRLRALYRQAVCDVAGGPASTEESEGVS